MNKHVLLIEPDRVLATACAEYLGLSGFSVVLASHAQDAVFAADERRPDAVVLEVQLPGHNGIEFLHEFRTYPEWADIPIIVHSLVPPEQLKMNETHRQFFGIESVLYKPVTTLKKLHRTLIEAVQKDAHV